MKLTPKAILAINNPRIRVLIAATLKVTEQTIIRYISGNEINNDLTKAASMEVIRKETGLVDTEILEKETISEVVQS